MNEPVLTVGMPAYNEEENIRTVLSASIAALEKQSDPWELIVVDNHSNDGTVAAVRSMMADEPRIRLIEHESNRYYSGSVASILREARGQYIMVIDSDGQFTVEDLPAFMARFAEGDDLIFGWRKDRKDPVFRLVASWVFKQMGRFWLGFSLHDLNCGIRMFNRKFADIAEITARINLANPELFACAVRHGMRVGEVEVRHFPRVAGTTCNSLSDSLRIFGQVWSHMRQLAKGL